MKPASYITRQGGVDFMFLGFGYRAWQGCRSLACQLLKGTNETLLPFGDLRRWQFTSLISVLVVAVAGCSPSRPQCSQPEVLKILEGMLLPGSDDLSFALTFGPAGKGLAADMTMQFSGTWTKSENNRIVVCETTAETRLGPKWESFKPSDDFQWPYVKAEIQAPVNLRYSAQLTDKGDEIVVEVLAKSSR